MPPDHTLKALAAARTDHVHALAAREDRDRHGIPRLERIAARCDVHFAPEARRRNVGLLVVTPERFADLGRSLFDETELNRLVAVGRSGLGLHHDARAGSDDRRRIHAAVGLEDLRHPDFLADDSCDHASPWFLGLSPWSVLGP